MMENTETGRELLATDRHRWARMFEGKKPRQSSVPICENQWLEILKAHSLTRLAVILACLSLNPSRLSAETDFAKDVAPIFQQHCVRCHSPGNAKGDISLATFAHLKENEYVVAGDPDGSYLIELVTASDGEPPAMPKESAPLAAEEVATLRRWIAEGAKWPDDVVIREKAKADASWWAYQPLQRTHEPGTTIDDFIRAGLAEHDLDLSPEADRRTLIRRATYDLIGLPPTPDEAEAFVNDPDLKAYEKLIDRLLDSPHYGERWGRHWLDVVRFGESNGFERNFIIDDLWPFRDYVIESLNEDRPFDQFIREHIAGDVIGNPPCLSALLLATAER